MVFPKPDMVKIIAQTTIKKTLWEILKIGDINLNVFFLFFQLREGATRVSNNWLFFL